MENIVSTAACIGERHTPQRSVDDFDRISDINWFLHSILMIFIRKISHHSQKSTE